MNFSEKETRSNLINLKLSKANWNTDNIKQVLKEYPIPVNSNNANKCLFADYVLIGKDNYPLAVIEAKKHP